VPHRNSQQLAGNGACSLGASWCNGEVYEIAPLSSERKLEPAIGRIFQVNQRHHFEEAVEALPLGPLKVTLRHKPNPDNPHAIAAFVGRQQVGWLATDWSADDPHVVWVNQLAAGGIRALFAGECKLSEVRRFGGIGRLCS
jgi:hypothetical protein